MAFGEHRAVPESLDALLISVQGVWMLLYFVKDSPSNYGQLFYSQATPSLSLSKPDRYPGSPAYIGAAPAARASAQLL